MNSAVGVLTMIEEVVILRTGFGFTDKDIINSVAR
jgi:hypothetical protein